jgi:hypothetical protein
VSNKTQGVYELVSEVLRTISEPYGEDVIRDVCVAIERHARWLRRYNLLVDELGKNVVNQWIGQYTKQLTGLRTGMQVDYEQGHIIGSYTKLYP